VRQNKQRTRHTDNLVSPVREKYHHLEDNKHSVGNTGKCNDTPNLLLMKNVSNMMTIRPEWQRASIT